MTRRTCTACGEKVPDTELRLIEGGRGRYCPACLTAIDRDHGKRPLARDRAPVNAIGSNETPTLFGATIPWEVHETAWEGYRRAYPESAARQDANRIAERGGFGRDELDAWAPGWRAGLLPYEGRRA